VIRRALNAGSANVMRPRWRPFVVDNAVSHYGDGGNKGLEEAQVPDPSTRKSRKKIAPALNAQLAPHVTNGDIISPCRTNGHTPGNAAWELASMSSCVDARRPGVSGKQQLPNADVAENGYMHPNGQIPAYGTGTSGRLVQSAVPAWSTMFPPIRWNKRQRAGAG